MLYLLVSIILIKTHVLFFGTRLRYRILNKVFSVIHQSIKGRKLCLISIYHKISLKSYYIYNIIYIQRYSQDSKRANLYVMK